MNYSIKKLDITEENLQKIKSLYKSCHWDWPNSDKEMLESFSNSFCLVGCFVDDKIVSFGRAVSDGSIYAFIVDVMVLPSFRKNGIATSLIQELVKELKSKNIKVIQLLSSKEGKALYLKVGFTACNQDAPGMILFPQSL